MYLGIDLGTGSLKCLLLDGDGHTFAESSATYGGDASARAPGEMAVEHWRRGLLDAVNRLPAQARQAVRAIGLSGQMHGVVLLDAAGQALRPALLWTISGLPACARIIPRPPAEIRLRQAWLDHC